MQSTQKQTTKQPSQLMCKNEISSGRKNGMATLMQVLKIPEEIKTKYSWAQPYECNICNATYFICNQCNLNNSKSTLHIKSRLARHHSQHNTCKKVEAESIKKKRKHMDVRVTPSSNIAIPTADKEMKQVMSLKLFDRAESYKYFSCNERNGEGAANLVSNALFGTSDSYKHMNEDDITLHLLIAKFVKTLSRIQRVEFSFIMEMLHEKYHSRDTVDKVDIVTPYELSMQNKLPRTDAELRNIYVVGKKSIVMNLPRPNVEIYDNHSYVSIRQCIAHFFASGKVPHEIGSNEKDVMRNITDSPAAISAAKRGYAVNKSVHPNNIMILLGLQWSDAFDPNSSVKSNRGAVWIKTVTFISETFNENRLHDTFPISIGLKSDSHDAVEKQYVNELIELGNGINNLFYCARRKKYVTVHFEIIASLGDQPERREMNYLIGGNGKFGARYLFSACIESMVDVLPPCKNCYEKLRNLPLKNNIEACTNCLAWDITRQCAMTKYDPPSNYPKSLLSKAVKLKPVELTFQVLNAVIEYATLNFLTGEWNETELVSYTSAHGISKLGSQKIIQHCNNKMSYELYQHQDKSKEKDDIDADYMKQPDKYKLWEGGPYWRSNLKLNQFVDVLMHLLFLGITKSTKDLVYEWISQNKRLNAYKIYSNSVFKHVADMGLDWCKLLVASSGWVSDNYVAFARICKWFYHPIIILHAKETFEESTIPIKHWYAKMCRDWLTAHGHETNGRLCELRQRILTLKNDTLNPPKLCKDSSCSSQLILHLIGSLLSMISSIMKNEASNDTILQTDREIKLFLTNVHIVQDHMYFGNQNKECTNHKTYWLTKYNHLSLLNIPNTIKLFGPLINLWEGSNQGEGYLRFAKPKLTNIHSKNWNTNAHTEILNEISLEEVIEYHVDNYYTTSKSCKFQNYRNSRMHRQKKCT